MEILDFYKEFMQDLYADSMANEDFLEEVFVNEMCRNLEDMGAINGYSLSKFQRKSHGLRIDAWFYDDTCQELSLFISEFNNNEEPFSLIKSQIEKCFLRAERFVESSTTANGLHTALDESDPGYEVARELFNKRNEIRKAKLFLLSNGIISKSAGDFHKKSINNIEYSYDIWEVSRLARLQESGKSKEDLQIKVTDYIPKGIKALRAHTGSDTCKSFLFVAPGEFIAKIYDEYGDRLLEQNVRTFLQFRGKVNKGIRNTIKNQPDMFFAYNNGLTATAEDVTLSEDSEITDIQNFQIVNGGQTTAAIFNSKFKEKGIDLSKVFVQVKLSVIPSEDIEEVVPKISEYANTQNKVNAADFFANHPFHLRIEEFSRRIWAPSKEGSRVESHWFYERARGQFGNAQSKLTKTQRTAYLKQNPKNQVISKTDLAKYENCFNMLPNTVSKGAQFNFCQYAAKIKDKWEKSETSINELYFKTLVAKAIIFKSLDKSVYQQDWYGGYKANIVAYTLSLLTYKISSMKLAINFEKIWQQQSINEVFDNQLLIIAKLINDTITDTTENVTQYCKKEYCWTRIKERISVELNEEFVDELLGTSEIVEKENQAKKTQKEHNEINAVIYVVEKGADYWQTLSKWALEKGLLSPKEMSIISVACQMPRKIPSDKQAKVILNVEQRAKQEGFWINE